MLARGFGALELYAAGYTYAELSGAGAPAADLAAVAAEASGGAARGSRSGGAGAAVGGVFAVLIVLALVVAARKRYGRNGGGTGFGGNHRSKDDQNGRRTRKPNRRGGNTSSIADVLAMSSTTHVNSQFDIASNKAGARTLLRGQKVTTGTGTEYLIIGGGGGAQIDAHLDAGSGDSSGNRKGGRTSGNGILQQGKPEMTQMLELVSVANDNAAEDADSTYTNTQGGRGGGMSATLTRKQSFLIPIDAASFETPLSSTSDEASGVGRNFAPDVDYGNAEVRGAAAGARGTNDGTLFVHDKDDSEMYEPFNDLASTGESVGSQRQQAEEGAAANPYSEPSGRGQLYMTPGAGAAEYEPANDGASQLYMTPVAGTAEYEPAKAAPINVIQVYADNVTGNENEYAAVPPSSSDFEQPLYMNEADAAAAAAGWVLSDDSELYMNGGMVENAPPLRTYASESKM